MYIFTVNDYNWARCKMKHEIASFLSCHLDVVFLSYFRKTWCWSIRKCTPLLISSRIPMAWRVGPYGWCSLRQDGGRPFCQGAGEGDRGWRAYCSWVFLDAPTTAGPSRALQAPELGARSTFGTTSDMNPPPPSLRRQNLPTPTAPCSSCTK